MLKWPRQENASVQYVETIGANTSSGSLLAQHKEFGTLKSWQRLPNITKLPERVQEREIWFRGLRVTIKFSDAQLFPLCS